MSTTKTVVLAVLAIVLPGAAGVWAGRAVALRADAPEIVAVPAAAPAPVAPDPPLPDPLPVAAPDRAEPDVIGQPGFFHLERRKGVWWLVDPQGKDFVSIGMNHLEPPLMLSQVNRASTLEKYGPGFEGPNGKPAMDSPEVLRWEADAEEQIRGWGFNTLGMHNPVEQRGMPYIALFRPAKIDSWQKKPVYPDPWDPAVAADVARQAAEVVPPKKDDRLLLGWMTNDWVNWHTKPGEWNPWQKAIMKLQASAPGKQAWVGDVRHRHASVAEAAGLYGVEAKTWNEFAAVTDWPPPSPKTQEESREFLPKLATRWYSLVSAAVRANDPNHLLIGDKLDAMYGDFPDWMDGVVDANFDMANLQWFQPFDLQVDRLRRFHARTGKPVLIGDSGFSTPSRWLAEPKPIRVASSAEVGRSYADYLDQLMHEPYAVGWHWCGYIMGTPDLAATVGKWPAKQYGFLDPDGTPHHEELRAVTAANRSAVRWHAEAKPLDPSAIASAPSKAKGKAANAKAKAKVPPG